MLHWVATDRGPAAYCGEYIFIKGYDFCYMRMELFVMHRSGRKITLRVEDRLHNRQDVDLLAERIAAGLVDPFVNSLPNN